MKRKAICLLVATLAMGTLAMAHAIPNFLVDSIYDALQWMPGPYPANENHQVHHFGTLIGDNGQLVGTGYSMVNAAPSDTGRVRPIIGVVTTVGPGSVRFIHGHATGAPGSTGFVNAGNFQITCSQSVGWCKGLSVAATGPEVEGWNDPGRAAEGLLFETSAGGRFSYAIYAAGAAIEQGLILAPQGPGGRVEWMGGAALESPRSGVVKITGALENETIRALEARIAALEGALINQPPSLPTPPPPTPPIVIGRPWYCDSFPQGIGC